MKVRLDRKSTGTHKWDHIADFEFAVDARHAARALSRLDGGIYRTADSRWPDEGFDVTVYSNGDVV